MSKEKKTTKELISDVFDAAPKEPNAFEIFDDPKPAQKGNDPIPTATWSPEIARTIFGDPTRNWTITSINTVAMPMVPVNMQFNLNCIKKGDNVTVTIWHYDDAGRVVSQATLNGSISDITPERMEISVVNPLNSGNTEITITPSDMINNGHIRYAINCGTVGYPNAFGIGVNYPDRTMPWNPAATQSGF